MDECRFVPDEVLASLVCHFPDSGLLERLLSQLWVPTWKGWQQYIDRKTGADAAFCEELRVDDVLQLFFTMTMDRIVVNHPSDQDAKKELVNFNLWEIRAGDAFRG